MAHDDAGEARNGMPCLEERTKCYNDSWHGGQEVRDEFNQRHEAPLKSRIAQRGADLEQEEL